MLLAQTVRKYLGWCPVESRRDRTGLVNPDPVVSTPQESGSLRVRTWHWLGLFRNQMIVLAFYFSAVGILLSLFLGGFNLTLFFIGIVAGSLLSVFQGFRFWKTMNEVRDDGAVFLASLYDKTTITVTLIVAMIPMAVSLGAIPGITMTMLNPISGGFIFILFWWALLVVWIWESREKRHLQSDGLMLSLAREADNAKY